MVSNRESSDGGVHASPRPAAEMPIKVRFAVFYQVYAVKSLRLLTGFADFPVFLRNTAGKSDRNENSLSEGTSFGNELAIRHSRFASLSLAKLVASLALHPPSSATGSGGFVPRDTN